jgi:hypothetical protein
MDFDISEDREECDELGWGFLWDEIGFCAVGDVEILLPFRGADFIADTSEQVLFGWAEDLPVAESGPARGTIDFTSAGRAFPAAIETTGLQIVVGGIPVSWGECAMAVPARGPDGVDAPVRLGFSPPPNGALVACPIQEP